MSIVALPDAPELPPEAFSLLATLPTGIRGMDTMNPAQFLQTVERLCAIGWVEGREFITVQGGKLGLAPEGVTLENTWAGWRLVIEQPE